MSPDPHTRDIEAEGPWQRDVSWPSPSPSPRPSLLEEAELLVASLRPPPCASKAQATAVGLARRPSLREREKEEEETKSLLKKTSSFMRKSSLRRKKDEGNNTSQNKTSDDESSGLVRRSSLRVNKAEEVKPPGLARAPSMRKKKEEEAPQIVSLSRKNSLRRKEDAERIAKIQASPSNRRKEFGLPDSGAGAGANPGGVRKRREVPSPSATPSLRRKNSIRHTLESLRKAASGAEETAPDPNPRKPLVNQMAEKVQLYKSESRERGEEGTDKERRGREEGGTSPVSVSPPLPRRAAPLEGREPVIQGAANTAGR